MKKVCSYCKCRMDSGTEPLQPDDVISHGICRKCLDKAVAGFGESQEDYLDSLHAPIIVVDDDVRVLAANSLARNMLSSEFPQITGHLGGEVFRCQWHDKPGGCGKTVHCKSCTIRNTVARTFESGEPCTKVPACLDLDVIAGPRRVRFAISTEKVDGVVFLRIHDAQPEASAPRADSSPPG